MIRICQLKLETCHTQEQLWAKAAQFLHVDPGDIRRLKQQGIRFYAAHLAGRQSYDEVDYSGGSAFMIGNEGNGLTERTAQLADTYVKIPMKGEVESLNAAVAAAVLTFEAARQRRK